MELPANVLQFRQDRMSPEEHTRLRNYYFGSCGDGGGFWPRQHRWGPWDPCYGGTGQTRTCDHCGLVSDIKWNAEEPNHDAD